MKKQDQSNSILLEGRKRKLEKLFHYTWQGEEKSGEKRGD